MVSVNKPSLLNIITRIFKSCSPIETRLSMASAWESHVSLDDLTNFSTELRNETKFFSTNFPVIEKSSTQRKMNIPIPYFSALVTRSTIRSSPSYTKQRPLKFLPAATESALYC